mgnify:FL=1|tara:strand:+ start:477 stop:878 length:402 start_codon:yes stop_codon:yes gene_type:complete
MIIYIDGVFDLLHIGHVESLKKAKALGDTLYVGLIDDETATGYKRKPIINEEDRYSLLKELRVVDKVIHHAPLKITREFIKEHNIDLVVHGFSSQEDKDNQIKKCFGDVLDIFKEIDYHKGISTTDIIKRLMS